MCKCSLIVILPKWIFTFSLFVRADVILWMIHSQGDICLRGRGGGECTCKMSYHVHSLSWWLAELSWPCIWVGDLLSYFCPCIELMTSGLLFKLRKVAFIEWWIVFHPTTPFPTDKTLLTSHDTIAIFMTDFWVNYIPSVKPFTYHATTLSWVILITFIFHWWEVNFTQTASSPELLQCWTDSQEGASWSLRSSPLQLKLVFPTYPHIMQLLLPAYTPLQHPHLVTFYLERHLGLVFGKQ